MTEKNDVLDRTIDFVSKYRKRAREKTLGRDLERQLYGSTISFI